MSSLKPSMSSSEVDIEQNITTIQRPMLKNLDRYVTRFLRGFGGASAADVSRTNVTNQS
jgi:hypothetical protein